MRVFTALPLLLACAAASCAEGPAPDRDAGAPVIVASIHPAAALVRAVAADDAEVRTLLPPGAHADTFEPTPRMAEAVDAADLVVRIGAGLDDWVGTPAAGRTLTLTDGLSLRDGNPHVWLDPVLVRDEILPRLADALAARYPDRADAVRTRATSFADSLTALDDEIRRLLDDVPTRRFVAAHPAWVYFAARYDLMQVGVLHPSPGEEIGTRELARLVDEARERGVRAVIAEPQLGRAGVETLAAELDVRVEVADAIGGQAVDGRSDYLALLRWNARAFRRALGGNGAESGPASGAAGAGGGA